MALGTNRLVGLKAAAVSANPDDASTAGSEATESAAIPGSRDGWGFRGIRVPAVVIKRIVCRRQGSNTNRRPCSLPPVVARAATIALGPWR